MHVEIVFMKEEYKRVIEKNPWIEEQQIKSHGYFNQPIRRREGKMCKSQWLTKEVVVAIKKRNRKRNRKSGKVVVEGQLLFCFNKKFQNFFTIKTKLMETVCIV